VAGPALPENAYRARAERGEIQIGTWITMIRTPSVLTLLQAAGLDYARLDLEHSAFSIETVADMATLARALDFPLVVRPPDGNREWITRLLDAGVWNLHIPQVESGEHAAAVVAATRYAPLGSRGMYGSGPHTAFRVRPHAFDRLDEIAAVPGIDALTIGPTDLAQDLGVLGTPAQAAVLREHRIRLGEAARKHGKTVAMAVDTFEAVRDVIALGATIVNYSSDVGVLRSGYAAAVAEIRRPKETA
jgi:2-keto-3-deoxy-L-rhamnonate aldolase RhmA